MAEEGTLPSPEDLKRELADLYVRHPVLIMEMTPGEAWALLATIQLASRHPVFAELETCGLVTAVARRIQEGICTTPAMIAVAEAGWDASQDSAV